MKKISIKNTVKMLDELGATDVQKELVLNNVSQYNKMLSDFQKGETVNAYLMYQLNVAIGKQIDSIIKLNKKAQIKNIKDISPFERMMKKMA
jgi:hypothetical protein